MAYSIIHLNNLTYVIRMKFTVLLRGSHTVIPLHNSVLSSNYSSVFVKRVSVFWEHFNISKQTVIMSVDGDG
jgi:hypothetical protein